MDAISYCPEYYLLSDTKQNHDFNIRVLLKGVSTDLRARNFVHARKSLCVHVARTLVTVRAIYRALYILSNGRSLSLPPANPTYFGTNSELFKACLV